jgi:hypothetical protein
MSFSSIEPPRRSVLMVDADTIDPASYYPSPGPEDHQTPPHIAASGDSDEELAAETSQMNLIDDLEDEEDEEEDEDGEGAEVEIGERVGGGEDGAEEDNWETRRTALPLPPEHLFKNNPSQPLLLKDFRVIKTLGECRSLNSSPAPCLTRDPQAQERLAASFSSASLPTLHTITQMRCNISQ